MTNNINQPFESLVMHAMTEPGRSHMRPVIEKELLHYDILFILDQENLLENLVFQGGTSLRLCYGATRFSEDLDFAGGTNFQTKQLILMKDCLESYLGARYGLEVQVKEPKELQQLPENHGIHVSKWQIRILTHPERRELPKQMITLEVANVPAYTKEVRSLTHNYIFLPDGYNDILIMSENLNEIMADKLIAFVNCIGYIRYRDLWDFRWLKQQGAILDVEFIRKKIKDYSIENYDKKLNRSINQIPTIIHSLEFKAQISRFIPLETQERTLHKEKFYDFLTQEINMLFNQLKTEL